MEANSIQAAQRLGRQRLSATSKTASLDTQVLLAHLTRMPKAWVLAHPEHPLAPEVQIEFGRALDALSEGIPLPYVLGEWEFFGRSFIVTPQVLIPRPETEGLVELALDFIDQMTGPLLIVDVGTGSGCIGVTLAAERPGTTIIALDRSRAGLVVAAENVRRHELTERVNLCQADLMDGMAFKADLIVANLPYIPKSRLRHLTVSKHEPLVALDGGQAGLEIIRRLISQVPGHVNNGGVVVMEVDESQSGEVALLMRQTMPGSVVSVRQDVSQRDRYIVLEES